MERKEKLSTIEQYMIGVFKSIVILIPIIALCAGLVYSVLKASGFYPSVSWTGLIVFDATCILYFFIAIFIIILYNKSDELQREKVYDIGKIFIAILMIIQWNFISYLIPSRDFWAYAVFFVMLAVFFLDIKYLVIIIGEIGTSLMVSWIVKADVLLPVNDELYVAEIVIRCVFLFLSFGCMLLFTYFVEKKLAHELEKIAEYDALTLLHNRRTMDKIIKKIHKNAEEKGDDFSVIMCDLDNFKKVNDTYGHECGDIVLKKVAGIVNSNIKEKDYAFRYGGEEILIIVRADKEISLQTAERIRREVEESVVEYCNEKVRITITMGLVEYKSGDNMEDLIKKADDLLYFGKHNGRNQVSA